MEKIIDAGIKLNILLVFKKFLSKDEENLLIKCSANVRQVFFCHPLKIDGWSPKHKIKNVIINVSKIFV